MSATSEPPAPGAWTRAPRSFLRPTARQYPFDALCSQIVAALEERQFCAPGMRVTFHDYGSGDQRQRRVDAVEFDDFRVVFGRVQGRIEGGHWNNTAAVHQIWVPRSYLRAYEDGVVRGATYEGDDWERDRDAFMTRYHDLDDLIEKGRPDVAEVCRYLQEVVLPRVEACPVPPVDSPLTSEEPAPVAVPSWLREVYCWASREDALRIERGRVDPRDVVPWERYGMPPHGWRLVPLGDSDGGPLPERAHDSFLWCGTRPPGPRSRRRRWSDDSIHELIVPGGDPLSRECVVVVVRPRSAHEIYVADQAAWDRRRAELAATSPRPRQYTGAEVRDFTSTRARTLVTAATYRGDYADPIVLVRRELGFLEVEVFPGQDALLEGWR